jgi:hypothetical protein
MRFFMTALLLLGLSFASSTRASTSEDALTKLRNAMKKEISMKALGGSGSDTGNLQNLMSELNEAVSQSEHGNMSYAQSIFDRISTTFASSEVKDEAEKGMAELRARKADHEETFVKNTQAAIDRLAKTALDQTTSEALDPLIKEAADLRVTNYGDSSDAMQRTQNEISYFQNFLRLWQDYLFAQESNDQSKAQDTVRNLLGYSDFQAFLPRSRLLKILTPTGSKKTGAGMLLRDDGAVELLKHINRIEDIDPAIKDWSTKYQKTDSNSRIVSALRRAQSTYQSALSRGQVSYIETDDTSSPVFARLRNQIFTASLASELGLRKTLPPQADEAVADYLQRVYSELEKQGDYAKLKRAVEATRIPVMSMRGYFPRDLNPRYNGLCAYLAGQNQEQAGQWMAATVSYQQGLRDGLDFVPAKIIGQRLDELKKQHPAEYRQGMAAFLGDTSPAMADVYLKTTPDPAPPKPAEAPLKSPEALPTPSATP